MCQKTLPSAPSVATSTATPGATLPAHSCKGHHHDTADTSAQDNAKESAKAHHCQCSGTASQGMTVGEEVRWVEASHELDFPPVPFPSRRIFDTAGEALLRKLVRRHHERLRAGPLGALFPADDKTFYVGIDRTADYIVEACGGPALFARHGGPTCMRTRHFPFTIDEAARETWLAELWQTFAEVGFPPEIRQEYWNWAEPFSLRMINRRTQRVQPLRYAFDLAGLTLARHMTQPVLQSDTLPA